MRNKQDDTQRKYYLRYALALLISLLLHLVVLGGFDLRLPALPTAPETMQVNIMPAPLPKPLPPVVRPKPKKSAPSSVPAATEAAPGPLQAPVEAAPAEMPEAGTDSVPVLEENEPPEEVTEAPPDLNKPDPVNYVEMDYEVKRGEQAGVLGRTHVLFKVHEENRYTLTSETEAQGLASLFVTGKLVQRSEGRVTEHGLQPLHFFYQYGNNEAKAQRAELDWDNHTIAMHSSKGLVTQSLPAGTQDLLSFMYQYMYQDPLAQMQVAVTNGKRLRTYTYSFEGEEQVQTRMGEIRALHIAKSTGNEKTELWLAVDYRYLPIKIRKTDEDGTVLEQMMTRLNTDIMK
ncbi:MAG TPA: DUF3108 domain-containing protein [Methylovorus sp.]|nr:DUF3108 domain-containing protein [Methylovorus sp.]